VSAHPGRDSIRKPTLRSYSPTSAPKNSLGAILCGLQQLSLECAGTHRGLAAPYQGQLQFHVPSELDSRWQGQRRPSQFQRRDGPKFLREGVNSLLCHFAICRFEIPQANCICVKPAEPRVNFQQFVKTPPTGGSGRFRRAPWSACCFERRTLHTAEAAACFRIWRTQGSPPPKIDSRRLRAGSSREECPQLGME
jgi:hypothetical protein